MVDLRVAGRSLPDDIAGHRLGGVDPADAAQGQALLLQRRAGLVQRHPGQVGNRDERGGRWSGEHLQGEPDRPGQQGDAQHADPDEAPDPFRPVGVVGCPVRFDDRRPAGWRQQRRCGTDCCGCGADQLGPSAGAGLLGSVSCLPGQCAGQVRAHLGGRLVAIQRVLGERLQDDGVHRPGHTGLHLARRGRGLADLPGSDRHRRIAGEGRCAAEQFVEQATGRVDVGAGIDRFAAGLLGGQIVGGADCHCHCPLQSPGCRPLFGRCRSPSPSRPRPG